MRGLKKTINQALEANDLNVVAELAKNDRKVLSTLVRLAYDKETLVGWRAIKAIGLASKAMIETDYEFLRDTVRKLLWSLSDESGGIGWSAPEILGEIVSADPARFDDIIPLIAEVYDIEEKIFRPGIMYALARIAEHRPDFVLPYKDLIGRGLSDADPAVRVYALELLAAIRQKLGKEDMDGFNRIISGLASDTSEVWVYGEDDFVNVTLGEYAIKMIKYK